MKTKLWTAILFGGVILLVGQFALSEANDWNELKGAKKRPGVALVQNELYRNECGACHFAYQPGLLPARSWDNMMSNLDNHFGENAELSPEDLETIKKYLMDNAADKSNGKISVKIMRSLDKGTTPDRITDVPYIVHKHHELSPEHVAKNPKVKSLSNCNICHRQAESGSFSEHGVLIPGFGAWND